MLRLQSPRSFFFFFNDTATTEIYTLSLHDALPIFHNRLFVLVSAAILLVYGAITAWRTPVDVFPDLNKPLVTVLTEADRKSTRLNSSHLVISYAVFCLKKKTRNNTPPS